MSTEHLTGNLDWSLLKWIKKDTLNGDIPSCVTTIGIWAPKYKSSIRVQIECDPRPEEENDYGDYIRVESDDASLAFETKYSDEFLREFVEKVYAIKHAKLTSINYGGLGEDTVWGEPFMDDEEIPARIIQKNWRRYRSNHNNNNQI